MTQFVPPNPEHVSLGVERLDLALAEHLPPAEFAAVDAILRAVEGAHDAVLQATREHVGGADFATAAGLLASILDTRTRVLGYLGRSS